MQWVTMIGSLLGLNTGDLKKMGLAAAKKAINGALKAYFQGKRAKIVKHLETVDHEVVGTQQTTGKDGETRSATANAVRNGMYLYWKALVRESDIADGIRDAHDDKVMAYVESQNPTSVDQAITLAIDYDVDLSF